MPVVYDIRQQIPQFKDNHFPPYHFQPYPKMLVNKETGKPYKTKTNKEVIVQNEEEEKDFLATLSEDAPRPTTLSEDAPRPISKIAKIEVDETATLSKSELKSLSDQIQTAESSEPEQPAKRRGRPPSLPKDLK